MDQREKSKPLMDAIVGASPDLRSIFHDGWAHWFSLALSDIALLTEGADVLFADTVVDRGDVDHAYSARTSVFTEHLIITVTADVRADGEHHTTSAHSRADLRSLEVAAEVGSLGSTWPSAWPGEVRVTLDYGDGRSLVLPGAQRVDREQYGRVVALLPSLRADLTARTP